jgi:hypothetical protein
MSVKQVASGRRARSVCIVTQIPLRLQHEIAAFRVKGKPRIIYLESATIRITESASADLVIEIEPP